MTKFLKKREEFFNKEISGFKKKEQALLKKLERLEPPKSLEPPKEEVKVNAKKDKKTLRGTSKDKLKAGEKAPKKTKKQL